MVGIFREFNPNSEVENVAKDPYRSGRGECYTKLVD
jgi:hypothetical protein